MTDCRIVGTTRSLWRQRDATVLPLKLRRTRAMPKMSAAELLAEAAHLRKFAGNVTEPEVLAEMNLLIAELERRAQRLDTGGATDDQGRPMF
jgi:hypothetical protein